MAQRPGTTLRVNGYVGYAGHIDYVSPSWVRLF